MDWQTFSIIMLTWTVGSFPFALLVGRILGEADRLDRLDRLRMMEHRDQALLLPAPSAMLPSPWAVAREKTRITA